MKHGFTFDGEGRVPDNLLLAVTKREWLRRVNEFTVNTYARYKLEKLNEVIKLSVEHGLSALDHNGYLRLVHRIKALKTTQAELDSYQ